MSSNKLSPNNSLRLRGTIWHLHYNVPRILQGHPHFKGRKIFTLTLDTQDVFEARRMRDEYVALFSAMKHMSTAHRSRTSFLMHYAEAKLAVEEHAQRIRYMTEAEDVFNDRDALESAFSVEAAVARGDIPQADVYLAVIHGNEEVKANYAVTLKNAAFEYMQIHDGKIIASTLSRIKKASASLSAFIGGKEVKLQDVTKRQVTRWIEYISKDITTGTRRNYLASLQKMWQWAWTQEYVDGDSPFTSVKIESKDDSGSYEPFTLEEVQGLVAKASPALLSLMRTGLITGCRLSEIVGLTPASFLTSEGVHFIRIFKGKTDAAARDIPLPVHLWEELRECIKANIWKGSKVVWSQRFGKLKQEVTGERDRVKAFHSFRHMTATAYERAHVEERITAVILGHKSKRGESMSYGLYSAGLSPQQYLTSVNAMIQSDYMQSFLKLFK